jgi:hypothetical protein
MSNGRSVAQWSIRQCKICKVCKPRSEYEWVKKGAKTGISTIRTCRQCKRRWERLRKIKDYYTVPGEREAILERNKQYQRYPHHDPERLERIRDYHARWHWANRRANDLLDLDGKVLVCIRPATEDPIQNERRDERYGMDIGLVFTDLRQQIPIGWRPIMWVENTIVDMHMGCPDEWHWFVRYVDRRSQKRRQEAHNGKAKQTIQGA